MEEALLLGAQLGSVSLLSRLQFEISERLVMRIASNPTGVIHWAIDFSKLVVNFSNRCVVIWKLLNVYVNIA